MGRGGLPLPLLMGAGGSEEERKGQQRDGVARLHTYGRGRGELCGPWRWPAAGTRQGQAGGGLIIRLCEPASWQSINPLAHVVCG